MTAHARGGPDALLPCPFCGSAPVVEPSPWLEECVRVACADPACGVAPRTEYLLSRFGEELAALWNRRPPPPSPSPRPAHPRGAMPTTLRDVLDELESESVVTRTVLERIPDDRLHWRPHERSRTLGELGMHVAQLPAGIAEIATWDRFDVALTPPHAAAASRAEILAALDEGLAQARAKLTALGDDRLAEPWRVVDGERELLVIPRAQLLRSVLLNHWYHHRGQLTVYLRLVGVSVPAVYGDSADESPVFA